MSELLNTNINRGVAEVSPTDIKILIAGFLDDANKVMGRTAEDRDVSWLIDWTVKYLNERYGYLPMHHVRAAIEYGSLGERGGTAKLMPRNIAIWIREQANIFQEMLAKQIKADDDKARFENMNANKAEWQVAAAVRVKVTWFGEKMINSKQYDSFSSKAIYDLLKSGVKEKDIRPRHVVPNYENTI